MKHDNDAHLTDVEAEQIFSLTRPDKNLLLLYIIYSLFATIAIIFIFPPLFFRYITLRYRFDQDGVAVSYEFMKKLLLPLLKVEVTQPEPLPGHQGEVLQIIRACPAYLQYKLFFWKLYLTAWTLGVMVGSVVLVVLKAWLLFLVIPVVILAAMKAAILYVAIRLDYEVRWYIITEHSLMIRQGAWVIREICLTYVNAQNVLVLQGPLQRFFGFSNVVVDTAGGGAHKNEDGTLSHRAVLRGLDKPDEARDLILSLLKRHRTGGLGDPDDLPEAGGATELDGKLYEIWQETRKLRQVVENR